MKNMTLCVGVIVLGLGAWLLSAVAQDAGGPRRGPPQWGGRGERPPSPPSAGELATNLMAKCDANGDGRLNADELTKGLTEMRKHRPPAPRSEDDSSVASQAQSVSDKAAQWIEKYAADETGLTLTELQKAMESDRPPRHPQSGPGMGGPPPEDAP